MFYQFTAAFKWNFDTVSCSSAELWSFLGGEKQKSTEIIHQIWIFLELLCDLLEVPRV